MMKKINEEAFFTHAYIKYNTFSRTKVFTVLCRHLITCPLSFISVIGLF